MADDVKFVVAENSTYDRGTPYVGKQEIEEKLFARVGTEWDGYGLTSRRSMMWVTSSSCKGGSRNV
jgi:hypothetical protein